MTERIALMVSPEKMKEIDDFRFSRRYGSRSDAIRDLIDRGLKAVQGESEKGQPDE